MRAYSGVEGLFHGRRGEESAARNLIPKMDYPKADNSNSLPVFGAGRAAFDCMQAGRRAKSKRAVRLGSEKGAGGSDPKVELACQ